MKVQRLFIYPVKSLLPVEVSSITITAAGLQYDRSFVIIIDPQDESADTAEHLTIKTTSQLCLFEQSIDFTSETLTIKHTLAQQDASHTVRLCPSASDLEHSHKFSVSIFGSTAVGHDMGSAAASYFSKHLSRPARLLYIGEGGSRPIPSQRLVPQRPRSLSFLRGDALHPQQIAFADGAPILITTTASEEDAIARLPEYVRDEDTITRFRPNIHVSTPATMGPYEEEKWKKLTIHPNPGDDIQLDLVFSTIRCMSLNVDFATGGLVSSDRQLYKLLMKDRRVNPTFPYRPCFGRYAFAEPLGSVIRVGDVVEVTESE